MLRFVDQEDLDDLNPTVRQQYFQKLDAKAANYQAQQLRNSLNPNLDEYFRNQNQPLENAIRSADAFREDQALRQRIQGFSRNYSADNAPRALPTPTGDPKQQALDALFLSTNDPRYLAYKAQLDGNSYQPPAPSNRSIPAPNDDFVQDFSQGF